MEYILDKQPVASVPNLFYVQMSAEPMTSLVVILQAKLEYIKPVKYQHVSWPCKHVAALT